MQDLTDEELDRIVDDILDTPAQPDPRGRFVCRRCGMEFRSEKKAPTLCPSCMRASRASNGQKGLEARWGKGKAELPPEPTQETRPEAVPEPDPQYLTVRNLLDLLARVPDPERVPVMLGEQTAATGLELRSVWRIGGETSAVIIIRNE